MSDRFAKQGRDMNQDFSDLWAWIDLNLDRHCKFVCRLHVAMLAIAKKVVGLTGASLFKLQDASTVLVRPGQRPEQQGEYEQMARFQQQLKGQLRLATVAPILQFFTLREWSEGGEAVCTWLELLADYLLSGGPVSAFDPSHTEIKPTTVQRALRLFIHEATAVLRVHARPEFAA
eukprot:11584501-Alexandrium_andersonii.AAC.1